MYKAFIIVSCLTRLLLDVIPGFRSLPFVFICRLWVVEGHGVFQGFPDDVEALGADQGHPHNNPNKQDEQDDVMDSQHPFALLCKWVQMQ